jgi:hypothetical protein
MKSSKAPALATWLVEHLLPRGKGEVLAGDLLEQFNQGRSAAWYWRQVLVSLFVIFSKELSILWVAAGFTVIWISVFAVSLQWLLLLSHSLPFQAVFSWGVTLAWPISEVFALMWFTALNVLPLLISLTIYLGAMKCLNVRRLLQGLLMGVIVSPLGYITGMLLPVHFLARSLAGFVVVSIPLFLSLLVSLWAVQSMTKRIGNPSFSA